MINLAGTPACDKAIKEELNAAGIDIVNVGRMDSEVPASFIGKCNNFIFKRAWRYWVAEGCMPLPLADSLFEKHNDLPIRVNGNSEYAKPIEWCEPRNFEEDCRKHFNDFMDKKISGEEFERLCDEIKNQGDQFVMCYHIDTQEGLNAFADFVRANNIIG